MLFLLTSDIQSYDLLGLNVKTPDRPLSKCIPDKDSGPTYGEFKWILTYMLEDQGTELCRNEEEFQLAQRYFVTNMNEATYWQKM